MKFVDHSLNQHLQGSPNGVDSINVSLLEMIREKFVDFV